MFLCAVPAGSRFRLRVLAGATLRPLYSETAADLNDVVRYNSKTDHIAASSRGIAIPGSASGAAEGYARSMACFISREDRWARHWIFEQV